jgi:hypothetical protein
MDCRSSTSSRREPRGDRGGVSIEPCSPTSGTCASPAGQSRHRGGGRRPHPVRAQAGTKTCTSNGCATSRTGASAASCGGVTASRPGTTRPATSMSAANEAEVRAKHASRPTTCTLRQDEDVLDTWFSSALWTFSTLGWPDKTEELALPPDRRAGHRLRHHLLLGRPDDHDDHALHGWPGAVQATVYVTAWCATKKARRCPSPRATCSTRST